MGVRISWLMFARNSLLARLAASAASCACLSEVMSIRRLTTPPSLAGWLLMRSLETLELRMTRASENAAKVADFLANHPGIERIGYLGHLAVGGREAEIYSRQCAGPGSTLSVYVKGGEAEAFRFLDRLVLIKLAVSLGGTESLASHPAAMTHIAVPDDRKMRFGLFPNLVRISVGIENPDDLIADLRQALEPN